MMRNTANMHFGNSLQIKSNLGLGGWCRRVISQLFSMVLEMSLFVTDKQFSQ